MNLAIWKHRHPINGELNRLRDEMDRTIDRLLGGSFLEPKAVRLEGWMPVVDVSESEGEFVVRAEVPGIAAGDLDVSISGTSLVISGKKKEEEEKSGEDFCQSERRFGTFRRTIAAQRVRHAQDPTRAADRRS